MKNKKEHGFFCPLFLKETRKGNILTENVIFIALNLTFFAIMILFLTKQAGGAALLEQAYAKQIALIIDSAKPGMEIIADISDGAKANEKWFKKNFAKSVTIEGNIVHVRLTDGNGYSYSFFNGVKPSIDVWPEGKVYILVKNG